MIKVETDILSRSAVTFSSLREMIVFKVDQLAAANPSLKNHSENGVLVYWKKKISPTPLSILGRSFLAWVKRRSAVSFVKPVGAAASTRTSLDTPYPLCLAI